MRFKQIFGALLLLGFLGFLTWKLVDSMSAVDDGILLLLLGLILITVLYVGMKKILEH